MGVNLCPRRVEFPDRLKFRFRLDSAKQERLQAGITALAAPMPEALAHDQSPRNSATMRGTAGSSVPTNTVRIVSAAAVNRMGAATAGKVVAEIAETLPNIAKVCLPAHIVQSSTKRAGSGSDILKAYSGMRRKRKSIPQCANLLAALTDG